jgi:hypothetical protein
MPCSQRAEGSIVDSLEDDEGAERRAFNSKRVAASTLQQGLAWVPLAAGRQDEFRHEYTIFDQPPDRIWAIDLFSQNSDRASVARGAHEQEDLVPPEPSRMASALPLCLVVHDAGRSRWWDRHPEDWVHRAVAKSGDLHVMRRVTAGRTGAGSAG